MAAASPVPDPVPHPGRPRPAAAVCGRAAAERAVPRAPSGRRRRPAVLTALALVPLLLTAGCGYGSRAVDDSGPRAVGGAKVDGLEKIKLGYFPNVTHATPLAGLRDGGEIPEELGGTEVSPRVFDAGPAAIEALNAKAVDMLWVGPSPAINGYAQAHGKNLRIVAGATSGGASLVVNPDRVASLRGLKGKKIATPQLGNTQDVALLHYLAGRGTKIEPETGKGDVPVLRQDTREIPTSFRQGGIDGAWVPEPTASLLVEAGGKRLLNEKELWRGGKFVTTNLVVRQGFLKEHPDAVEAVVRGSVEANAWIRAHPGAAKRAVNAALERDAGRPLPRKVLDAAFAQIDITDDPLPSTLKQQAAHAVDAGLLKKSDLRGIYDLTPLNKVLASAGRTPVHSAELEVNR
ncbi:aliphatic sulfonate ABC transporter substrate-binding protein [Streptomyces boncukensis]|uniref:Aliphatic sulfonate ABC transporter substrate-binding protein n=1 Tax=Streptomyces boncukensis TaxID=2711219 RepID=A0A6G4WVE5_9ACTN|nr:aliphatic sulfonate ABC transporter substrate-binding protein [Streptomyces boncukensis]NGO68822.1 aliphatic sulfonate ABC transporter substrate-binding protein [Streptomyces boncukensis]